jgi:hypothetical protein
VCIVGFQTFHRCAVGGTISQAICILFFILSFPCVLKTSFSVPTAEFPSPKDSSLQCEETYCIFWDRKAFSNQTQTTNNPMDALATRQNRLIQVQFHTATRVADRSHGSGWIPSQCLGNLRGCHAHFGPSFSTTHKIPSNGLFVALKFRLPHKRMDWESRRLPKEELANSCLDECQIIAMIILVGIWPLPRIGIGHYFKVVGRLAKFTFQQSLCE